MFNSKLFFETVEKLALDGIELKIKKNDKNLEAFIEKIEGEEQGYINFTTNDDKYIFKGKYTHKESYIFGDLYYFLQNQKGLEFLISNEKVSFDQSNLFYQNENYYNNKTESKLFETSLEQETNKMDIKKSKSDKVCEVVQNEELYLETIKSLKNANLNINIELKNLKIYKFNNEYFFNSDFIVNKKLVGSIEKKIDSFNGKLNTKFNIIDNDFYKEICLDFPKINDVIESIVGIEACKKELKHLLNNDILLKYKIDNKLYIDLSDNFEKLSKKTLDDLKQKHSGKECFLWNNKEKKWFNLDKVQIEYQQIKVKDI